MSSTWPCFSPIGPYQSCNVTGAAVPKSPQLTLSQHFDPNDSPIHVLAARVKSWVHIYSDSAELQSLLLLNVCHMRRKTANQIKNCHVNRELEVWRGSRDAVGLWAFCCMCCLNVCMIYFLGLIVLLWLELVRCILSCRPSYLSIPICSLPSLRAQFH